MSWNPDKIVELLLDAGEIALRSRRSLRTEVKADRSLVTQVDREIEALITSRLEDESSGVRIIGEETVDQRGEEYIERALREECYVIDPIDGTVPYVHGMPTWGVSIGYMVEGEVVDGAVWLPEFGEIVLSDGPNVIEGSRRGAVIPRALSPEAETGASLGGCGHGSRSDRQIVGTARGDFTWRTLAPSDPSGDEHRLIGITQKVAKYGRAPVAQQVQVLGTAVVPLLGLVQGRFAAYLGSVKLWDVAGALPLVLRHGFSVSVNDRGTHREATGVVDSSIYHLEPGHPQRWSFRSSLLVCRPTDVDRLRGLLEEH
jgi:myo-inositol-1(or 4)-monophosphatase